MDTYLYLVGTGFSGFIEVQHGTDLEAPRGRHRDAF